MIRGVALFGVLMVNLMSDFRVPLFEFILRPGTNWIVQLIRLLLEFKSMDLFCLSFGMGMAIQFSRAADPLVFLSRRFAVLAAFGLVHLLLIWNGDILMLYAVAGLFTLGFLLLRLPVWALAAISAGIYFFVSIGSLSNAVLEPDIAGAAVYGTGTWLQILSFRTWETGHVIGPLLLMTLPRAVSLFLAGVVIWRGELYRRVHPLFAIPLLAAGYWSDVPMALGYAVLLFAFWKHFAFFRWAGQMALTNYLTQSVVLTLIFYGYGLGYFGKLAPEPVALIGIALYVAQLFFSRYWLARHRFGPVEFLWRWMTYGVRPLKLVEL